eukprot:1039428-Pelagomonas_calceolata.AAC.5
MNSSFYALDTPVPILSVSVSADSQQKRTGLSKPKRPRALRKGPQTSKLQRVSPKARSLLFIIIDLAVSNEKRNALAQFLRILEKVATSTSSLFRKQEQGEHETEECQALDHSIKVASVAQSVKGIRLPSPCQHLSCYMKLTT